jgi:hypothetical protein
VGIEIFWVHRLTWDSQIVGIGDSLAPYLEIVSEFSDCYGFAQRRGDSFILCSLFGNGTFESSFTFGLG